MLSGDPVRQNKAILDLVRSIERHLFFAVAERTNLVLQMVNAGVVYFATPGADGTYADGVFRLIVVSNDSDKENDGLELQQKRSGVWQTVAGWAY